MAKSLAPGGRQRWSGGSAAAPHGGYDVQDFEDNCRRVGVAGDGGGGRSADDAGVGRRLGWVAWRRLSRRRLSAGGWHGGGWAGGRSWHPGYWRGGVWYGGWWGPAIAAGVLTGAAIAASAPYWGGYGYDGYGYGGQGCWQVRPTYDAYGNFLGQQNVNVC